MFHSPSFAAALATEKQHECVCLHELHTNTSMEQVYAFQFPAFITFQDFIIFAGKISNWTNWIKPNSVFVTANPLLFVFPTQISNIVFVGTGSQKQNTDAAYVRLMEILIKGMNKHVTHPESHVCPVQQQAVSCQCVVIHTHTQHDLRPLTAAAAHPQVNRPPRPGSHIDFIFFAARNSPANSFALHSVPPAMRSRSPARPN